MKSALWRRLTLTGLTGLTAIAATGIACAQNMHYNQVNLVADTAAAGAANTDPNLKGLWGISQSPTSPFWVSDAASGLSTIYNTAGLPSTTVVTVPPGAKALSKTGTPTGQVNNGTGGFRLANGNPASFIFATLDGTISAWNGGTVATVMVDKSGTSASYTGLAIGISDQGPTLYAANNGQGTIDTFDTNFKQIQMPGGFLDVGLEPFYSPFNIQRFGRRMVVTYANPTPRTRWTTGPGSGTVNIFDLNGQIIQRITSEGKLNAPWGVAFAPQQFGAFSAALLVGNFGDGQINAYDPFTGEWRGTMQDSTGKTLSIPGLWGLQFGSGSANGGDAITLYVAADVDGTHGLFGALRPAADSIQP